VKVEPTATTAGYQMTEREGCSGFCWFNGQLQSGSARLFDEMPRSNNIDVRLGGVKLCALERRNFAPPRQP
jgi:hypothetical protein